MERQGYYGIVGNGETCALVSPAAGVDWLCLPRFDGTAVFSRARGGDGDALALRASENGAPLALKGAQQAYVEDTNILRTTMDFGPVTLTATDFMPWKGISESIRDRRFLFRLVEARNNTRTQRTVRITAATGRGVLVPGTVRSGSGFAYGLHMDQTELRLRPLGSASCALTIAYGTGAKEVRLALRRAARLDPRDELRKAEAFWTGWLARGRKVAFYDEDYTRLYHRSLLACKLLTCPQTGAIVAAPTASFPATPGGGENWDYRFCWLRDAFYVCRAFLKTGHVEEVKDLLDFVYALQEPAGNWLPLYTVAGKKPGRETAVETGRGTVRTGNSARMQLQLDTEGSVLHLTSLYYRATREKRFVERHWRQIARAADWIMAHASLPENGIWELREQEHKRRAHWTYGKVLCSAGLGAAMQLAEALGKEFDSNYFDWLKARAALKQDILRHAWSPQRGAFLQTYDRDAQADISALAIAEYGLLNPRHPRLRSTVRLLEKTLVTEGGGVKRFEDASLPFYFPTLLLAKHLIRAGNSARARRYLDACIRGTTSLGLAAEHFNPVRGTQHGNFPQAFNHSLFVETLLALRERNPVMGMVSDINAVLRNIGKAVRLGKAERQGRDGEKLAA